MAVAGAFLLALAVAAAAAAAAGPARPLQPLSFAYHTNEAMFDLMDAYAAAYPNLAATFSIGKSVQGRDLKGIRITNNIGTPAPGRPMFKYIGAMHGNEVVGRQVLIYFIQHVLDNFGVDAQITTLVNTTDMYIVPTLNPDGFNIASPRDCGEFNGRENANGYDLNRNFPDQFQGQQGAVQPETQAAMDFIKSKPFVLSANLHGGSVVASYPYDDSRSGFSTYTASPDDDIFRSLALTYSMNHRTMHNGGQPCVEYQESFKDGITNGAAWYSVPGGMQDFNYLQTNDFEITVELSCCKYPEESLLQGEWDNNRPALIAYALKANTGVRGFVRDATSGVGLLGAVITVDGREHTVRSTGLGEYWRLLLPGTYSISVSTPGYATKTVQNIVVGDTAVNVDFSLDRVPS